MLLVSINNIMRLLLDKGADINVKGYLGQPPLHIACEARILKRGWGHIELVKLLLEKGAGINDNCMDGKTPLHYACEKKNKEIVNLLLENGAMFDFEDESVGTQKIFSILGLIIPILGNGGQLVIGTFTTGQYAGINFAEGSGNIWGIFKNTDNTLKFNFCILKRFFIPRGDFKRCVNSEINYPYISVTLINICTVEIWSYYIRIWLAIWVSFIF